MLRFFCFIASLLATSAVSALDIIPANSFPDWFQKAQLKEKKIKKKSTLKIEALGVEEKIIGKITSTETVESTYYYVIDIGTGGPIECYALTEFDGTATSFYAIIENSLQGVSELNEAPLTGHFTQSIDSGVIGSSPYLRLDTFYNIGEGANKRSGLLKGLAAHTNDSLQVCVHNQIGYRETFFTAFESFVSAIAGSQENNAFFEAVYQFKFNGIPAGFGRETYSIDSDGDVASFVDSAFIVPVDASSISRIDNVAKSWGYTNGDLINTHAHTLENGAYSYIYSLSYKEDAWVAEGETQGKTQSFVLDHKEPILSNYGSYLLSTNLLDSDQSSLEASMWLPDADPSSVTKVKLNKVKGSKDANLEFEMGPMTMSMLTDELGVPSTGSISQGPMVMTLEKLYQKGKPQ